MASGSPSTKRLLLAAGAAAAVAGGAYYVYRRRQRSPARNLLPRCVVPRHYTLWLKPDLVAFTFEGRETVRLSVVEQTNTIVLHAHEARCCCRP